MPGVSHFPLVRLFSPSNFCWDNMLRIPLCAPLPPFSGRTLNILKDIPPSGTVN